MTCKRCQQTIELDGHPGSTHRVRRVCGCANGPTWTDRPSMGDLISNQQREQHGK